MEEMMKRVAELQETAECMSGKAAEALFDSEALPESEELSMLREKLRKTVQEMQDLSDYLVGGALIYGAAVGRVS